MKYAHLVNYFAGEIWAIEEAKFHALCELLTFKAAGGQYTAEEIDQRIGAVAQRPTPARSGAIAVLPLFGTIVQRAGMLERSSGATSTEDFAQLFRQALADDQVASILMHVDSPGGAVSGVNELSAEIHRARGRKPIVALADSLAASAAYDIATAADELIVTPSGRVGSIGVFGVHYDQSKAAEMQGIKPTVISAGKYKTEGHPFSPLSDEALGAYQQQVNDYYQMFVSSVARNRGVGVDAVRAGYGEGRALTAKRALTAGMVDGIATFDETVKRMASRSFRSGRPLAALLSDDPAVLAEELAEAMDEALAEEGPVDIEALTAVVGRLSTAPYESETRRRRMRVVST